MSNTISLPRRVTKADPEWLVRHNIHYTRRSRWQERVSSIGPIWLIVTMTSTLYIGVQYILPLFYTKFMTLKLNQIFACIAFGEMLLNWLCVRLVDTRYVYNPDLMTPEYNYINLLPLANGKYGMIKDHKNDDKSMNLKTASNPKAQTSEDIHSKPNKEKTRVYVVTIHRKTEFGVEKSTYPYWSWKPCITCQHERPPRVHHCHVCRECILKRDHHCFFTGTCIGLNNQRHFVVFVWWTAIATTYSLVHGIAYCYWYFLADSWCMDVILPVTVARCLMGYDVTFYKCLLVAIGYSLLWFCPICWKFVFDQFYAVSNGVTTFELDNEIKVANTNNRRRNIRGVFGNYWIINFIIPLHLIFRPHDTGIYWHGVTA